MGTPARIDRGLPILPPGDFRAAAVRYMTRDMGVGQAGERYSALISGASDVLASALATLHEDIPEVALDFSESSLDALDDALARRASRGRLPSEVIVGVGSYLGEVLRIRLRGSWRVRYDPKGGRGFRASTVHFDPGLKGHGGFESEVFRVAESLRQVNGTRRRLRDHLRFASNLMDHPEDAPRRWNGSCCRPVTMRRPRST